jgi:hypothetical protein
VSPQEARARREALDRLLQDPAVGSELYVGAEQALWSDALRAIAEGRTLPSEASLVAAIVVRPSI